MNRRLRYVSPGRAPSVAYHWTTGLYRATGVPGLPHEMVCSAIGEIEDILAKALAKARARFSRSIWPR